MCLDVSNPTEHHFYKCPLLNWLNTNYISDPLVTNLWCFLWFVVACLPLMNVKNGAMFCSLGADKVPSYEDTCSFICNTGYELTGSDTRTCQRDGSWSGTQTMCRRSGCLCVNLCTTIYMPILLFMCLCIRLIRAVNCESFSSFCLLEEPPIWKKCAALKGCEWYAYYVLCHFKYSPLT